MNVLWEVIDTGVQSAEENMAIDATLLKGLGERSQPMLHFYEWKEESMTYGHFIDPWKFLKEDRVKKRGLDIAKRSTGGGMVFHLWDMAFSVLVPATCSLFSKNSLENYALVNNGVLKAASEFLRKMGLTLTPQDGAMSVSLCSHFCMARPTKYDVVLNGKKVAGAAQRQTKDGFLHQGTIALMMPSKEYLTDVLKEGEAVISSMMEVTYPLLGKEVSKSVVLDAKMSLKRLLTQYLA